MATIRAVAFDIGNVLIDWLPEALVDPVAAATGLPGDVAMKAVFALYGRSKRRLDLGDLSPRAFHAELSAALVAAGGRALSYADWLTLWCGTLRARPGVNALVGRVRPDLAVAVWSNTDPVHFGCYSTWLSCLARARSLWLSFVTGLAKPDPAYFEGALAALGLRAEEVTFLDDTPANVEAARAMGIDAVQVATIEEVEAALGGRGLLTG